MQNTILHIGSSHQAEAQSQSVFIPPELFVESSSALSVANTGRDELAPGNIDLDSDSHGWDKSVGNVHRNSNWFGDMEETFMASVKKGNDNLIFVNIRIKLLVKLVRRPGRLLSSIRR